MNADAIPLELQALRRWVVWRWEPDPEKPDKPKKPPYRADAPAGPDCASNKKPEDWTTFQEAVAVVKAGKADGIGFALLPPYAGVDLDPEMRKRDRRAIILALDSYTETSPSGEGEHVVVKADLNGRGRHPTGFGVWTRDRFFYFTGQHITGTPTTIEPRQAELDEVLEQFLPKPEPARARTTESAPVDLGDRELLNRAMGARNGADFRALWNGMWEAQYPSQSEADMALCAHLAFWTGDDVERIDRLFRSSGLYRPKWERPDYGEKTIEKALCGKVYTPSESSRPERDAVGTQTESRTSEKGETAIASPRPDVVGTRDGTQSFSDAPVSLDLRFQDVLAFAKVEEPGAAAIVGDDDNVLVPEDGDVMFYGDGGAGKTTMMIDLGFHVAAGDDWLGIPVANPVRVAIIENEGPRALFRAKVRRKLKAWEGSGLGDRLLLLEEPWAKVSVDAAAVRAALAAKIADLELDVVVIGPVTRSGMNEAGTLQQVRDYGNLLGLVRAASGRRVTFLLAHHENRGGQVSGAWEGAVDTLFHVQAQGHGQTRLFIQKARWSPAHHKQKLQLVWADGEGFEVVEEEERDDNTIADEILAFVRDHGGTNWNKVDDAVSGKGGRLRAIRDNLLDSGRLVNRGTEARMKLWHADDPALPHDDEGDA